MRNQARSALRNDLAMMFMGGDAPSPSLERLNARVCDFEQAIEADAVAQLTCKKFRSALEAAAFDEGEFVFESG